MKKRLFAILLLLTLVSVPTIAAYSDDIPSQQSNSNLIIQEQ